MVICTCSVITSDSKILVSPTAKCFSETDTLKDVCSSYLSRISDSQWQHENVDIIELIVKHENSWVALDHSQLETFDVLGVKNEFCPRSPLTLKLRLAKKADTTTTTSSDLDNRNGEDRDASPSINKATGTASENDCWWSRLCFPKLCKLNPEHVSFLQNHGFDFEKIYELANNLHTTSKILLLDFLVITVKSLAGFKGVRTGNLPDFMTLLTSIRDCLWYVGPHSKSLDERGCKPPAVLKPHMLFNNPRHASHGVKQLQKTTLERHVNEISHHLEKSYVHKESFKPILEICEQLVESVVKYIDYLEEKSLSFRELQQSTEDDPNSDCRIDILPILSSDVVQKVYPSAVESEIIFQLKEALRTVDINTPVHITHLLPHARHKRYNFLRKLRTHGFASENCGLLTACVPGSCGYVYHIWLEDSSLEESSKATIQLKIVESIKPTLPKFFSRAHKRRCQQTLNLLMLDKIKPAEFRAIYQLLTGDSSVGANEATKAVDERYLEILATADPSIIRDFRVNNGRKSSFDPFWDLCNDVIREKTVVDERRHGDITPSGDVVTHMAVAISAKDLYEQCCKAFIDAGNSQELIPSFSWFRFQFWPKSNFQRTSLHYTGRLNVKFMVQQRQFRKSHVDQHYVSAVFCYVKSFAVQFRDFTTVICTDDKHKVSVGEPNCPIAAVDRGKRVPVAHGTTFEVMDHDFSLLSLIPTVILHNNIPETKDGSWYRGKPYVGLKLTATEPSTALRSAVEIANCMLNHYGSKENIPPIMLLYTDGGPEHRTNFLSVKIAMLSLARYLDLDCIIAARTSPGHSYLNPAEKVNCILNLGLYGVGVMRKKCSDPEFEAKLCKCSNLTDIRGLEGKCKHFKENLESTVCDCRDLIKSAFSRLKLKDESVSIFPPASDSDIDAFFKEAKLDCNPKDTATDLPNRPVLKQILNHCCKERTYFFSYKKCDKAGSGCDICSKSFRLPADMIANLHHLPDPMPGIDNHYKSFEDVYGTNTTEEFKPSLKEKTTRGHGIPFTPLLQHANNVKLYQVCSECDKPRLLYSRAKLSAPETKDLKRCLNDKLYTCGAVLSEFKENGINSSCQYMLDKVYVRENLNCQTPVEILYYSSGLWGEICCHCGSGRKLTHPLNCYPICSNCVRNKKENVMKRKRRIIPEKSVSKK